MSTFKTQFDSASDLIRYFMQNDINLSTPCEIQINSIFDWVSNANFEPPQLNSLQNNTDNTVHPEHSTE